MPLPTWVSWQLSPENSESLMKILSIDTSTSAGSITLSDDDRLIGEINIDCEQTHSVRMLLGIETLLKSAGFSLSLLDAFAAICGPGSFTGLRIGLTTIKGLANCFSKPIIPITGFEAWVEKFAERQGVIVPVIDARRGEVYASVYRRSAGQLERLSAGVVERAGPYFADLSYPEACFVGWGASQYQTLILSHNRPGWCVQLDDPFLGRPMCRLAWRKAKSGELVSATELQAYYLRKSDAELNWKESEHSTTPDG
jgi:tRNA threonylcarbamoyladenosine biosynthesis protein TsaB